MKRTDEADLAAWKHHANEWADAATNVLTFLANLRDGTQTYEELVALARRDIAHAMSTRPVGVRAVQAERATPRQMNLPPRVVEAVDSFMRHCLDHGAAFYFEATLQRRDDLLAVIERTMVTKPDVSARPAPPPNVTLCTACGKEWSMCGGKHFTGASYVVLFFALLAGLAALLIRFAS